VSTQAQVEQSQLDHRLSLVGLSLAYIGPRLS